MIDKPIKDLTQEEREQVIRELKEIATPEEWESLTMIAGAISDAGTWLRQALYAAELNKLKEAADTATELFKGLQEALPIFVEEMERDGTAANMNPHEFIESGKYDEIMERTAQRLEQAGANADEVRAGLPVIIARNLEKIDFPVDKVNKDIWRALEADANGQLAIKYDVAKKGSNAPVDILYTINFADLEKSITRKLEPYDKRVYTTIASLFNEGNDIMSLQMIYKNMGYKGRMSATDIKKINNSISKMAGARIYIDNVQEINANYKYDHFRYDGALLPMERIQAVVNGQVADAAIHIFREPPMMTFARERKQITTFSARLLDSPLSKTNGNIELEDYLIEEIARIKNGKRSNKLLFKTIYEHANITTTKQKQRAPGKIRQLLDHYKAHGFIKAYDEKKDGIIIKY